MAMREGVGREVREGMGVAVPPPTPPPPPPPPPLAVGAVVEEREGMPEVEAEGAAELLME